MPGWRHFSYSSQLRCLAFFSTFCHIISHPAEITRTFLSLIPKFSERKTTSNCKNLPKQPLATCKTQNCSTAWPNHRYTRYFMFNRQLWEAKLWTNKILRESIQGNAGLETVTEMVANVTKQLLILSMHVIDLFMNYSSMTMCLIFLFHLNPVPPQMTASSAHISKIDAWNQEHTQHFFLFL